MYPGVDSGLKILNTMKNLDRMQMVQKDINLILSTIFSENLLCLDYKRP